MSGSANAQSLLETAVNGIPPASVSALDDASKQKLAQLIDQSRQRQQKALQDALEEALGHLPRILRGPVKRVLFPKGGRK